MSTSPDALAVVAQLFPVIQAHAEAGDRDRCLPEELVAELRAAGLFRLHQPGRHGGAELSVTGLTEVAARVGEADGSTAWVLALYNASAWMVGLLPGRAQAEVWQDRPDALVCGALPPLGTAEPVPGGYRIGGRWPNSSGSAHADWALLGVRVPGGEPHALVLVPRTELGYEDTWSVTGMRGTGSNTLTAAGVFVPEHRVLPVGEAALGRYRTEHTGESLYRSAFYPVLLLALAGPQLGLGRAALRFVREAAATKRVPGTRYGTQAESVAVQVQLARAALLLDTAELHVRRATEEVDAVAARGEYPDELARTRARADVTWAVEHVRQSIELLLDVHGSSGFAETSPLQRIWRDASTAARHAQTLPGVSYEVYGKALLGRQDRIMPSN
ncbi:alkylation response protein AidB-like acyl-CoA dehydrogenase [Crossiella equi]|uniref:Alkylation response protein AidB-like acyl-CoA dehydrogenase n=1 Tax=Crossiella equi TaxID=130796 RepID=A0ABS5A9X5_9PSEU|nr:acyl-CoA dehydrogenase family protein [Crossiella equi]MBP2473087.1 alkylation response protein AidB-like acyl-CoA dehydrogenase [Crossiella equi]